MSDTNLSRLFELYAQDEMEPMCRLAIVETFLVIAKNIGLRKLFLKRSYIGPLMKSCLKLIDIAKEWQSNGHQPNEIYL